MNSAKVTDLVEDSLRLLDEAGVSDADFQTAARTLYGFQSTYQTRATYFRLMDVLERRGYFATVPVEEHPEWEEYRDEFDAAGPESIAPVFHDPSADWDADQNPVVAYLEDDTLYVQAGTELWEALVAASAIEQVEFDAEKDIFWAVARVCREAESHGETDLILGWYATLGFHLGMESGADEDTLLARLKSDPNVQQIRQTVAQIDNLELEIMHPERNLDVPPPPLRKAHPVLGWWFDLM